jgi:anti-sigma factor RsiW
MSATIEAKESQDAAVCRRVRTRLCEGEHRQVAAHLAACPACAAFASRLDLARQALAAPLSPPWAVRPDANFSARVAARIERPSELLGWAAFRALPAALGLAMALALLGFSSSSSPAPAVVASAAPPQLLLEEPSADQLVAWASAPAEAVP